MTTDNMTVRPPRWAEALLRLLLPPRDRDSVSGDLLEAYRDTMHPARGTRRADAWYLLQVAGFVWRAAWPWALVFSGAFIARTAYDWRVPTDDFSARSQVSTIFGIATLASVGFWAAWRSGSFVAGPLVAAVASQIAAVFNVAGVATMLAIWHDAGTRSAINGSGGLGEVFTLPFIMVIPAVILGMVGGAAGSVLSRLRPSKRTAV